MPHNHGASPPSNWPQRISPYVFFGFVAVAAFYLIAEHRAHIIPFLPFLLLGACLLMHIFMHRRHGHRGRGDVSESETERSRRPPASDGQRH